MRELPKTLRALIGRKHAQKSPITLTISKIPGGQTAVFRLLSLSDEPDAQKIVAVWRKNGPDSHKRLSLDELLEQADLSPRDFVGLVSRVSFDFNIDLGNTIAATAYPSMMQASVVKALDVDEGTEERRMHFQHTGFVPVSKGIQIGINNRNGSDAPQPGAATPHGALVRRIVRDLPPDA